MQERNIVTDIIFAKLDAIADPQENRMILCTLYTLASQTTIASRSGIILNPLKANELDTHLTNTLGLSFSELKKQALTAQEIQNEMSSTTWLCNQLWFAFRDYSTKR